MAADRFIVVPLGTDLLAFTADEIEAGRQRAREIVMPSPISATPAPEPLLTAEALARLLDVPTSQIETLGRQGRIPSVMVGKYRRFRYSAALAALKEAR